MRALNEENLVSEHVNIYLKSSKIHYKGYKNHLHTLEPTGIRILRTTIIHGLICEVTVDLYIHNGKEIKFSRRVLPNAFSYIAAEEGDHIFLDITQTVPPEEDPVVSYEFIFRLYKDSYEIMPILDIRHNKKVSQHAIQDEGLFKDEIFKDTQKEKGMIMISENIRMYITKCKNIPRNLNPKEILNFYESVIKYFNEFAGFDENSKIKQFEPRKQSMFLTDIVNQANFIEVNSQRISVKPELIFFLFTDFLGIVNTVSNLFDPWWNLNNEWTFMCNKYFIEKTLSFNALWEDSREDFESFKVRDLYKNYFTLKDCKTDTINLPAYLKMYFLITLEELFGAGFAGKTEILFRKNLKKEYEDFLEGIEYIIFAISKNYSVNILPYAKMYGLFIYDQILINKIVDNSNEMFFYIPNNENFKIYKNNSIPVTLKTIYVDEGSLVGMCSPNSKININLNNQKFYETYTNSEGKFQFKFPISLRSSDFICVTSKEMYKIESSTITITPASRLEDNIIKFLGGGDYEIARIMFDTSKKILKVISTGIQANIAFSNEEYFSFVLLDSKGNIKAQSEVLGKDNANEFSMLLNDIEFEYLDEILLTYEEKGRVLISNINNQSLYNPKYNSNEFYLINKEELTVIED